MAKTKELVLLYQFHDEDRRRSIQRILSSLNIPCRVLPADSWKQRVGQLLGGKTFQSADASDESFDFPHEVMILSQIKGKRLDQVLKAMKDAEVAPVRYKAVVTPFNTLWTLRRLCETMQKEHAYMAEREETLPASSKTINPEEDLSDRQKEDGGRES